MNHVCNWLVFPDQSDDSKVEIKETSTTSNYARMISNTFIPPTQNVWQQIFNYARDLDCHLIWKNGLKNDLLDPEGKNFWYKLKHMILPSRDVLHKIGKVDDVKCPLCETEPESYQHLFIYQYLKTLGFLHNIL